ncbi:MAG TPA: AMP-binding protein [Longimicrobiaceae bacterium]
MSAAATDWVGRLLGLGRRVVPAPARERLRGAYRVLPASWRHSPEFRALARELRASDRWSADRLAAHQLERLREAVRRAEAHVPAHRERFAAAGVGAHSLRSLDDLVRFPFLHKDDLRAPGADFLARDLAPERLERVTSGGTTGVPVTFHHVAGEHADVARAFQLALWGRIGFAYEARVLDLTASFGAPWGYADRRLLRVSIPWLDAAGAAEWLDEVLRFRPAYVLGLPSTVAALVQVLEDAGARLPTRGVVVGSEVLHPWQRERIGAALGCRVLAWYGMSEGAGYAAGCERSDAYHFHPLAGVVELVDDAGRPVTEPGGEGEIVLTGFHTRATPFIRFRTGDRGVWGGVGCPECGRRHPLLRAIHGRTQEFLVAADGRRVPHSALNVHAAVFGGIHRYQLVQARPGEVELRWTGAPGSGDGACEALRARLETQLGAGFRLASRRVEEIPRTARGKHVFVVREFGE